jgi:gamma-glutamyl:cysteine ligase YbdK (ATP-grasp superfamily)
VQPVESALPIGQILTSPDLIAAMVALLAALVARLTSKLKSQQKLTEERMDRMSVHVARAADAAESASEGVHNNHAVNLRDDLDMRFDDLTKKMDVLADAVGALRESVADQSRRIQGLEGQVEGVRNDARADRTHVYNEINSMHSRIDRIKNKA